MTEADGQVAVADEHVLDATEICHCSLRRHGGPVGGRRRLPGEGEETMAVLLAELVDEGGAQPVGPGDRLLVDQLLERVSVGMAVGRRSAHADRDASERARRDERLEVALIAAVGVGDDVSEPLWELGGEAAAWEVHEHRRPQAGGFGDFEHSHDTALLQPDDLAHELGDRGRRKLEHDVAGKAFQHRAGRPSRVAVHRLTDEAELVDDLVAEARDVEHAGALGPGREQTDEAVLPARSIGLALVRVADDEDAEALRPENRRHRVGPRHHRRT